MLQNYPKTRVISKTSRMFCKCNLRTFGIRPFQILSTMACSAFDDAVKYTLERVGKTGMVLKSEQREAIRCVYAGENVFVFLPTGFGKSICFEVLPLLFDYKNGRVETGSGSRGSYSVVLVVSLLVSLMADQVHSLRSRGVSAAALTRHDSVQSIQAENKKVEEGRYSVLFCAPEAIISTDKWKEILMSSPVNERIVAIVVDEAHCVSKW